MGQASFTESCLPSIHPEWHIYNILLELGQKYIYVLFTIRIHLASHSLDVLVHATFRHASRLLTPKCAHLLCPYGVQRGDRVWKVKENTTVHNSIIFCLDTVISHGLASLNLLLCSSLTVHMECPGISKRCNLENLFTRLLNPRISFWDEKGDVERSQENEKSDYDDGSVQ